MRGPSAILYFKRVQRTHGGMVELVGRKSNGTDHGLPSGQVSGRRQPSGFAETCNEWWENKGYDEKRKIWKEHNDC